MQSKLLQDFKRLQNAQKQQKHVYFTFLLARTLRVIFNFTRHFFDVTGLTSDSFVLCHHKNYLLAKETLRTLL